MYARLYKHNNNTDVAFEIIKKFYVVEKELYKLKVMWWNIGKCHAPWCMGITQNIEIKKADWQDWNLYGY